ncbi:hypothetical protein [Acinetobacter sp. MD2(2019)]|uniref:hypothetical protein n=1 Tax=Acinetobacter sp. MD2(2019) TaxID=2605273 RepID=UPI002D1E63D1|nr:hypothetical protein [Acinetobacter sp. MD2(2019)]MEB3755102.1 hypothetical protein [Acinetobacter sp. MD2(2019)]
MIEIFLICLIAWIIYAWKTGKFSKEYQEKNNAELKQAWNKLKHDFKKPFNTANNNAGSPINDGDTPPVLAPKAKPLSLKERQKQADELAKKLGTRSEVIDEEKRKLQAQRDYEYTLKLLGKSGTSRYTDDDTTYRSLPKFSNYRYVLEYRDASGSVTIRGIDIISVHKGYQNTRWYFEADTEDGERTFKSQRVIRLKDQWTNTIYATAEQVREHLLANYDIQNFRSEDWDD